MKICLDEELSKYGELESLNVCHNLADHMVGNVYAQFREEEQAAAALQALNGRVYAGRPISGDFSSLTDFREASCRQYEENTCNRGGFRWPMPFNENISCFIPKTLSDCQIPPQLFGHPESISSEIITQIHSQIPFMHFPTFTLDPRFVPYENANSTAASESAQCPGSTFDLRPRGAHYGHIGFNGSSFYVNHGELFNVPQINSQDLLDAKAFAASKSHSEAERRRHERINTHLATLRKVVNRVKELKRQAATITKASLCCNDRRDLLTDLLRTLRCLTLRIVKAEMATVGGRIKNVILLTSRDGFSKDAQEMPSISCVQDALRAIIEGRLSGHFAAVGPVATLKKPRLCPLHVST
ncbi:hypothetical protein O6H91_21G036300 [Diphasiastrum complanatum]|uniref:Uncharacterized protein n=1 Tax=Diphasiastrum complanatum TaxID=34168 RepID=A0ACC2AJH4_DIPCM|nr:hypothetical protein O6H91_21G036300 [Diphasiastrum complanatum]